MTFQRATALRIARLVRTLRPSARIVVGGYDPSLAPEAYDGLRRHRFHRPRRRRADAVRAAARARDAAAASRQIAGLSYRTATDSSTTATAPVLTLASNSLRLPNRAARVLDGYTLLGRQVDVVETSRGCTFDCSFCSIIEMRGRNFHPYPIERVLADIADARAHGARGDLPRRRQHHARRHAVRGAVPGDRRRRVQRHRLHRPGDDGAARPARRAARAADEAGRLPLRVPRHREHPRRRSGVPEGAREERAARARPHGRQRQPSKPSTISIATACSSSAA